MNVSKPVAVYCRVSTNEQHIETQVSAVRQFCELRAWPIVEIFEDVGISGGIDSRPALDRLKLACSSKHFSGIVVYRFDRLARSTSHLLECLELFRRNGIDFISVTEGIDTSTSVGKMVFTFLGGIAEFERALIRERVNAGIARAKAEGVKLGRPRRGLDIGLALQLQRDGKSIREIAEAVHVSVPTVFRSLQAVSKTSSSSLA